MKSLLLFAISFLCFSPHCLTQTVWPGDVNNNGIVNEIDFLYLGYAFNNTGTPRTTIDSSWIAQEIITEWEGTFPNGLNLAYADCNGDGIVDETDAKVIEQNIARTRDGFIIDELLIPPPDTSNTSDPLPSFTIKNSNFEVVSNLEVNPGDVIDLEIDLGSNDIPVKDFLGFAFTINVEPRFFKANSINFDFNPAGWLYVPTNANNKTDLILDNPEAGKVTAAFTKTDGIPRTGGGNIGSFSFVLIEDIVDLLVKEDTIKVEIDSITFVTDELEKIPVRGTSITIDIIGRTTSTYNPILDKIKFYPNPTNGWILLKSKEVEIEKVEIVNMLGQVVYQKVLNKNIFHSLDLQNIPEGMYWLRMITELGTKSTPIQRL